MFWVSCVSSVGAVGGDWGWGRVSVSVRDGCGPHWPGHQWIITRASESQTPSSSLHLNYVGLLMGYVISTQCRLASLSWGHLKDTNNIRLLRSGRACLPKYWWEKKLMNFIFRSEQTEESRRFQTTAICWLQCSSRGMLSQFSHLSLLSLAAGSILFENFEHWVCIHNTGTVLIS